MSLEDTCRQVAFLSTSVEMTYCDHILRAYSKFPVFNFIELIKIVVSSAQSHFVSGKMKLSIWFKYFYKYYIAWFWCKATGEDLLPETIV